MGEDIQQQQLFSGKILCKTQSYIKTNLFSATSSLRTIFLTFFNLVDTYTPKSTFCPTALLSFNAGNISASWADAWLQLKAHLPLPGPSFHFAMVWVVWVLVVGSFT